MMADYNENSYGDDSVVDGGVESETETEAEAETETETDTENEIEY